MKKAGGSFHGLYRQPPDEPSIFIISSAKPNPTRLLVWRLESADWRSSVRGIKPLKQEEAKGLQANADMYAHEISYTLPPDAPARYLSSSKFIFTAFGCALIERSATKSYAYYAVNLTDGKTALLARSASSLDKASHTKLAAKLRSSPVCGIGRFEADRPVGERLAWNKLPEILRHVFETVMPQHDFIFRENQLGLAEHMLDTISRRGLSLAESEVGTGKTLAYLISAVLAKRGRINDSWLRGNIPGQSYAEGANMPVVIATSSIALQRALATDYIPEISCILMEHGII